MSSTRQSAIAATPASRASSAEANVTGEKPPTRNPLVIFQRGFEARFERFRALYRDLLAMALGSRATFITGFMAFVLASFALAPMLGRNFFPSVDAGQILMHARVQVGTRVEETANQFAAIQKAIREIIPSHEIATMVDNVGMPVSGINLTYNNTGVIGPQDGDIQIKLTADHGPTELYVEKLRNLMRLNKDLHAPPIVRLVWHSQVFKGVLEHPLRGQHVVVDVAGERLAEAGAHAGLGGEVEHRRAIGEQPVERGVDEIGLEQREP